MDYEILYKRSVSKDLKGIDKEEQRRILEKIEETLCKKAEKGKKLKGKFEGLYSYRVGNYRVIYTLKGQKVLIARIRHRKEAYR